jgi:hypothetical protein
MLKIGYLSFIFLFAVFSQTVLAQSYFKSGNWSVNQSIAAYSLDKNNGDRSMTLEIKFDEPFQNIPHILLSISQLDADKDSNIRYKAEAFSISRDGFTLKVQTWSDSRIFSISGYWLAISE